MLEQTFEAFSPKVSATVKLAGVDADSPIDGQSSTAGTHRPFCRRARHRH